MIVISKADGEGSSIAAKLEQYRIFKEVADNGNISGTARKLFISQSAVSQSVRLLEDSLGVRLFSRTARGVSLTAEGRLLYDYVEKALRLLETGEERLAQTRELLSGELSIGANDTLTKYYLLPFLQEYHRKYPHIRVKIFNGTSRRVLELLLGGQVDLAFATAPEDERAFQVRTCFETHQVFVAAPDYGCDFDRVYTLEEMRSFPLILLERTASSRRYLEEFFLRRGLKLEPEIELTSHNLLLSLARIGLGVACVTEELSLSSFQRGVVRKLRVEAEIPARSVAMCTLRDAEPPAAARRFMEFVKEGNECGD
ncbi:MAG: LysR family transcriptional regulator [Oscillospiraceae bacterium]|nr:LysR family transcriptional regulator [Oscillospiraceae bacterium]